MATATAPKGAKKDHPLFTARDEKIAGYMTEEELATNATALGDKKSATSAHARKANRSREIRDLEFQMAQEGLKFEPWVKPNTSKGGSKKQVIPQDVIEADLTKTAAVYNGDHPASTKKTAEKRIVKLLKQAERFGYTVTDPRGPAAE